MINKRSHAFWISYHVVAVISQMGVGLLLYLFGGCLAIPLRQIGFSSSHASFLCSMPTPGERMGATGTNMITETDLPRVYVISAYTDEMDPTVYPVGSRLREYATQGTIVVSPTCVEYVFDPEKNGGVGGLHATFSQPLTEIDYQRRRFFCEETGSLLYEGTLVDGRQILIDESLSDACWGYWVIERIR